MYIEFSPTAAFHDRCCVGSVVSAIDSSFRGRRLFLPVYTRVWKTKPAPPAC